MLLTFEGSCGVYFLLGAKGWRCRCTADSKGTL